MRHLTLGEIVELHRRLLIDSGGASGIRDLGLLEPGFAADAVLLGEALDVQAVWGAGVRLS